MRRLFWTFPDGLPGLGLLLMRLATGGTLLSHAVVAWGHADDWPATLLVAAQCTCALGLIAGFLTPFFSACIAAVAVWWTFSHPDDPHAHALLTALAVSVALLGPGAVSVDAWLFGWRRIDVASKSAGRRAE